jgi:predicted nucleic acid-binding protein
LTAFAGLPQVTLEMPLSRDGSRLDDQGLDFADALHLARGAGCTAFISFDQRFAKAANRISDVKVRAP